MDFMDAFFKRLLITFLIILICSFGCLLVLGFMTYKRFDAVDSENTIKETGLSEQVAELSTQVEVLQTQLFEANEKLDLMNEELDDIISIYYDENGLEE